MDKYACLSVLQEIDTKVRKEIDEATATAKSDKEIPMEELWTDVYSKNLEPKIRGILAFDIQHRKLNVGANEK